MRQLTIVPIVTIEMDHPSEDWKDENTYPVELKAGLRKEMQKHIHFNRLKDDYDHMACFFWEYHRTVAYLNIEYPAEYSGRENFFPFTENSFPDTPYLSHRLVQRRKWFSQLGGGGINYEEDLLTPFGESDHEIEVDGEKIVFPIFNVPLNLHVNPNWKLEKFLALVREQWGNLENELNSQVEILKSKGHTVVDNVSNRPIVFWKKCLKLLGCYRLYHCVGLSWPMTRSEYGLKDKASEDRFRTDLKKNLSLLPLR